MNKYELNEQMFDQVLKYVAEERMDSMAKNFPSENELESEVKFSPEFQKRMSRYIKRVKYKNHLLSFGKKSWKAGAIAAVFVVICFMSVSNAEALRVPFLNFFNDINNRSTTIHVQDGDGLYSSFGDQIKGLYLPSYIPSLFKVKSVIKADKKYNALFENADGTMIKLWAVLGGSSTGIDSENADVIQLIVNGKQAQCYSKNGDNILIFEYDDNAFMLDGPIEKEELIKIAESMKFNK